MKQYKFELIRTRVVTGATKEIEMMANEYSKEGWEFKSAQYFNDILCFLLIFEKENSRGC